MKIVTEYQKRNSEKLEASESVESKMIMPADVIQDYYKWRHDYSKFDCYSYAAVERKLREHGFDKTVIVYIKDLFGAVFIMKSPRKHWAFAVKNRIIGGYTHGIAEIDMKKAIEFLDSHDAVILNEKEYEKVKKLLLVASL